MNLLQPGNGTMHVAEVFRAVTVECDDCGVIATLRKADDPHKAFAELHSEFCNDSHNLDVTDDDWHFAFKANARTSEWLGEPVGPFDSWSDGAKAVEESLRQGDE
jgi:hypothetical protein